MYQIWINDTVIAQLSYIGMEMLQARDHGFKFVGKAQIESNFWTLLAFFGDWREIYDNGQSPITYICKK